MDTIDFGTKKKKIEHYNSSAFILEPSAYMVSKLL